MPDLLKRFLVPPGATVRLRDYDPGATPGYRDKSQAEPVLHRNVQRLADLHYLLYAGANRAVLIILQAMDAGGKDGTIRHVMTGLNPQGCQVTAFKVPSAEELAHDFLWRVHRAVPPKGAIGIFNRSHYEDVLVVRVRGLVPKSVWSRRYDQINAFERILAENGVTIVKFFLHVSKDEQKERLVARLNDPRKRWKVNPEDFAERTRWAAYVRAYEAALSRCSTACAPWYIIPANHKWFRNLAVSEIIVDTLAALDMKFPKPAFDLSKIVVV